jgi:hypothetical protein
MKKMAQFLAILVFLFSIILPMGMQKPGKALALADVDQGCSYATDPIAYTFLSHEPGQIFMPTKNTLDAVQVYVKAGVGASASIRMEVLSQHHGTIVTKTQTVTDQWSWVLFDVPDVAMPMDIYGIKLRDADSQSNSVWMQGPASCYPRGWAIYEGHAQEYKYRFAINAFDTQNPTPAEPSNQGADQSTLDTSGTIGISNGTGSAPAGSTSTAVAAPTNLSATNESNYTGTGIRLNWTASTTSTIDGYKIFRSNSTDGGFTEIGKTINGVTIYVDSTVTIGQTYYYMVRAYKDKIESVSSNIATATAKDTFKEEILKDHEANSGGVFGGLAFALARFLIPAIIFGLIFILIIVGIILLVRRSRQKKVDQNQVEKK